MKKVELRFIMRLPHGDGLPLPAYQSEFAAGLDLVAAVPADAPVIIAPGERAAIPDRLGHRAAAGGGGADQAALRARVAAWGYRAQLAGHNRCRLSRRSTGNPCKSRHRIRSRSNAARGLRNWCSRPHVQAVICEVASLDETHARSSGFWIYGHGPGRGEPTRPRKIDTMIPYLRRPRSTRRCPMPLLPRKGILAITAVIDIALNARGPAGGSEGLGDSPQAAAATS